MKNMQLNTIESVLDLIKDHFKGTYNKYEMVPIMAALGRTAFEEIISKEIIPPYPKSTVDGYAIKLKDRPVTLQLIESVEIGKVYDYQLKEDECIYVPTGGMIPDGADLVVKIEETEKIEGRQIYFSQIYQVKENIIHKGEDVTIGDRIIAKGSVINAFDIGAFASLGIEKVKVLKKPEITIISTGDELVESNNKNEIGQVRDINTKTLSIISGELGLKVVNTHIVGDDYKKLKKTLIDSLETSDLVIISGGSSVGLKDYTYDIIDGTCQPGVLSYGIALKPGKPTIVAKANDKAVLGLPGHPVSAIIVFKVLMQTLLSTYGFKIKSGCIENVTLTADVYAADKRDTYQMIRVKDLNGVKYGIPTSGKSGMISLLTNSEGYVIIKKDEKMIKKNTIVKCHYF